MSPARFERTAPRLGIWCSIRLSYGDTPFFHNRKPRTRSTHHRKSGTNRNCAIPRRHPVTLQTAMICPGRQVGGLRGRSDSGDIPTRWFNSFPPPGRLALPRQRWTPSAEQEPALPRRDRRRISRCVATSRSMDQHDVTNHADDRRLSVARLRMEPKKCQCTSSHTFVVAMAGFRSFPHRPP